ncbi:hypothetical protein EPUS_00030 [Endocarpon pusillum Z07020]|uniref:Uncharacterized protein n=1 Tax=Endocarpon pusillum (strain Z07020 / HMAS-L-300199) TaxID=1263415 RepID=U1GS90_ENDPU|nr:uncharacterized protein EPUS_00030 [Endocarpon pusillum Z07020]ERF75238.1 hypothetical protein EPUS_00030 [Endocarpon pusillum Z07020]
MIKTNLAGQDNRTLFGTDTARPSLNLTVMGNEAQRGALIAAGVHTPETLQALLHGSRTTDLMMVLQTLRTQSSGTSVDTFESLLHNDPANRTAGIARRI